MFCPYFDVSIDAREEAYITFVKPLISDMLTNGYGLCLSEIRNYISNKMSKQTFYNHHIKNFISKQFESKVSFCAPFRKYESEVVFPSWISQTEMVSKLQALDSVSVAAKLLRSELQKVDFSLSDSFCDKTALENSMQTTRMPHSLLTFFSVLLNIPKYILVQHDNKLMGDLLDDEDYENNAGCKESAEKYVGRNYSNKLLQANSLFQTMYYMINNGRKKSLMQVMVGHTLYDKSKSKELITSLFLLQLTC